MSSRTCGAFAAIAFAAYGIFAPGPLGATAARADGMEKAEVPAPEVPAPKAAVRKTVHHTAHRRTYRHGPMIGYEIKHLHDDVGSPVYAMPAWPACQYVLDGYLAGPTAYRYEGRWDCGS
jgi:hypothetical protein